MKSIALLCVGLLLASLGVFAAEVVPSTSVDQSVESNMGDVADPSVIAVPVKVVDNRLGAKSVSAIKKNVNGPKKSFKDFLADKGAKVESTKSMTKNEDGSKTLSTTKTVTTPKGKVITMNKEKTVSKSDDGSKSVSSTKSVTGPKGNTKTVTNTKTKDALGKVSGTKVISSPKGSKTVTKNR